MCEPRTQRHSALYINLPKIPSPLQLLLHWRVDQMRHEAMIDWRGIPAITVEDKPIYSLRGQPASQQRTLTNAYTQREGNHYCVGHRTHTLHHQDLVVP